MAHGGDIYNNKIRLDFSTNLNPCGIPEDIYAAVNSAIGNIGNYPRYDCIELKSALAAALSVPKEYITVTAGASEALLSLANALKPCKVLIPVPTYTGYEKAFNAAGCSIIYYQLKEDKGFNIDPDILKSLTADVDMLVLCDPNNPTGKSCEPGLLKQILKKCTENDIRVIIDNSYSFFKENCHSDIKYKDPSVISLYSLTKAFAMPGIRLGFMVCGDKSIRDSVNRQLPEWNISVIAQEAGLAAARLLTFFDSVNEKASKENNFEKEEHEIKDNVFEDNITQSTCLEAAGNKYWKKTHNIVKEEREFLTKELSAMGMKVFTSCVNYILFKDPQGYKGDLYKKLLEKGILIRDCSDIKGLSKGYYRICIKTRDKNKELLSVIGNIVK